jgi:hypothetical protein
MEKPSDSLPAGKIVTPEQFQRILRAMPEAYRPLFVFLNETACRISTAVQITWDMLDEKLTRLDLPETIMKGREALALPLDVALLKPVRDALASVERVPGAPVFHTDDYLDVWQDACIAAGVASYDAKRRPRYIGPRVHDNRVAGARNLIAAGVDQDTVMKIGGWKSAHVFSRYNIVVLDNVKAAFERKAAHAKAA